MTEIVILAAGKGTRMRSSMPKVLHTLAGKPFVQHVIDTASSLPEPKISIVVGHGAEAVKSGVASDGITLDFAEQREQLGTGHAVQQALPYISGDQAVLILYGDVPLISESTLRELLASVSESTMALLTFDLENPDGYGRIVRDNNKVVAIVEQKDASEDQLAIKEINTGVMAVHGDHLKQWLPKLSNDNAQGEYYLTDIISMAVEEGVSVEAVKAATEIEITGVNSRIQQAQLERAFQLDQATQLLENGLSIADPARIDIRGELTHGQDSFVDVNCVFEGSSTIGNKVVIGPNCIIKDAKIGDNVEIKANSIIESSDVDDGCVIGPYARLRPDTKLAKNAKIGNFVETKKAEIGEGSKVNHLSYVGDAILGSGVNVGAGTITCNYDGVNKSLTTIEDGAFIGSNSALVAPVTIGKNATVGAGSTVTKDSSEDQLVLSRAKQRNLDGWQRPRKNEKS